MTPKEKAKEMIFKFRSIGLITGSKFCKWDEAEKCALICIDEILKYQPYDIYTIEQSNNVNKYWQEVKKEIEKL